MLSKWQGINIQEVYADWAESLGHLSIGAINYGIGESKGNQHPPSQGEFILNCRGYCPPYVPPREDNMLTQKRNIEHLTPEQKLSKLAELKTMIARKMVA
jgi:hypothetical protein